MRDITGVISECRAWRGIGPARLSAAMSRQCGVCRRFPLATAIGPKKNKRLRGFKLQRALCSTRPLVFHLPYCFTRTMGRKKIEIQPITVCLPLSFCAHFLTSHLLLPLFLAISPIILQHYSPNTVFRY